MEGRRQDADEANVPRNVQPLSPRRDSARITPELPTCTYPHFSLSLSLSLSLSFSCSRFSRFANVLRKRHGTLFGVTLLNIENRTGCPPSAVRESHSCPRPRMRTEYRFAAAPSVPPPSRLSGLQFVLIAGIYLILRTPKSLLYRRLNRSDTLLFFSHSIL